MTFRGDPLDNYKKALLDAGVSETTADSVIADARAEHAKIDAGICPNCGSKITKMLDPRQSGPTEVAGKWFSYRCGNPRECGWFMDRCEPVGEN